MTHLQPTRNNPVLGELEAALHAGLPELLAEVVRLLQPRWPDYAEFLHENRASIADAATPFVHRLVDTAMRGLANLEPIPLETEPAMQLVFEEIGRVQCLQAREITELLLAYRLGARAAWRHVSAGALRLELPPHVLAALAEAVFVFVDQLSSASAKGFAEQRSRSSIEQERLRRELADLLLCDRSDTAAVRLAAERAQWRLPEDAALVLVDPANPSARRIIDRLDNRCLVVRRSDLYGAIMPGSVGASGTTDLGVLLRDTEAVIGEFVPLTDFPASARLAMLAMSLRKRGLIDGDPVFVSSHLDAIIVHRDEEVFGALRRQVLRPLAGLSPSTRTRLTETLTSWLRHMGDRSAIADELFIHPQTVRYRMTQLRECFGPELDSPRTRARMLLALEWMPNADDSIRLP